MGERHNAVARLDQMNGPPFEVTEPGGEEFGMVERRTEHHKFHFGRQENHGLLPDFPAVAVIDVVALVEDDRVETLDAQARRQAEMFCRRAAFIKEIAEDFRRHYDDRGVRAELDVAGQNADGGTGAIGGLQIMELLVGERLDRCRVEDASALGECMLDLILSYKGFA